MSGAEVEVRSAGFSHGSYAVLADVLVTVGPQTRLAVVGPNGVGKSTLLSLIVGDLAPEIGTVTVSPPSATFDGSAPLAEAFRGATGQEAAEACTLLAKFGLGAGDVLRPMCRRRTAAAGRRPAMPLDPVSSLAHIASTSSIAMSPNIDSVWPANSSRKSRCRSRSRIGAREAVGEHVHQPGARRARRRVLQPLQVGLPHVDQPLPDLGGSSAVSQLSKLAWMTASDHSSGNSA